MDCVAFIVYSFSAKNPEWVIITELAFNKELNITFFLKSVINGATLIRARNFRLADFIVDFAWLWKYKSLFIIVKRSFCSASGYKVFLPNSIDSLAMSLFIIN